CLKAHELGIRVSVLSSHSEDPAAQVCRHWIQGSPDNEKDLNHFFSLNQTITFESEFIDARLLKDLQKKQNIKFYPSLENLQELQNRWTQKQALSKWKVPTAPYLKFSEPLTYEDISQELGTSFVIKKSIGGYDGYGTFIIHSSKDFETFKKTNNVKSEYIVESYIPFRRELAITLVRDLKGNTVSFPLVETFQESSRCLWVKGPTLSPQYSKMLKRLKTFIESINYVGVIAFEFFETKNKELLVNEIAPRVHNSSHYSLNGFTIDQFSLHMQAVTGLQVTPPSSFTSGFAMYNLIGSGSKKIDWTLTKNTQLHWYGKLENRPGRKMGHINTQGKTANACLKTLIHARKGFSI
ncbi:MAG: ATP-grasp domain-containing protein, partial [Bdellovibrionales bacterium]|nr:ATP-grasp domain-containing protein [Bdellovibrionales bacterium]